MGNISKNGGNKYKILANELDIADVDIFDTFWPDIQVGLTKLFWELQINTKNFVQIYTLVHDLCVSDRTINDVDVKKTYYAIREMIINHISLIEVKRYTHFEKHWRLESIIEDWKYFNLLWKRLDFICSYMNNNFIARSCRVSNVMRIGQLGMQQFTLIYLDGLKYKIFDTIQSCIMNSREGKPAYMDKIQQLLTLADNHAKQIVCPMSKKAMQQSFKELRLFYLDSMRTFYGNMVKIFKENHQTNGNYVKFAQTAIKYEQLRIASHETEFCLTVFNGEKFKKRLMKICYEQFVYKQVKVFQQKFAELIHCDHWHYDQLHELYLMICNNRKAVQQCCVKLVDYFLKIGQNYIDSNAKYKQSLHVVFQRMDNYLYSVCEEKRSLFFDDDVAVRCALNIAIEKLYLAHDIAYNNDEYAVETQALKIKWLKMSK